MAIHNDLGHQGEQIACDYILKKGYVILSRNFTHQKSEIDIIAKQDECIVFIEVKTRRNILFASPTDAVTDKKIAKLQAGALHFIEMNQMESEVRFDIISIILNENQCEIEHIENAFWN
ncbi:MAG: YraN family protein [Bacteroidota bacterium]